MTRLIALETEAGPCYLPLEDVNLISAPFQKRGHEPARTLGLRGGHRVYILDTEENGLALADLLPENTKLLAKLAKDKPKRGRKAKAVDNG